jgi:hypothetical protein
MKNENCDPRNQSHTKPEKRSEVETVSIRRRSIPYNAITVLNTSTHNAKKPVYILNLGAEALPPCGV